MNSQPPCLDLLKMCPIVKGEIERRKFGEGIEKRFGGYTQDGWVQGACQETAMRLPSRRELQGEALQMQKQRTENMGLQSLSKILKSKKL